MFVLLCKYNTMGFVFTIYIRFFTLNFNEIKKYKMMAPACCCQS
jgi:hypothetical protein